MKREYSKEDTLRAFELEQKYRDFLLKKYTSYMLDATAFELNLLAKLVDIRCTYNNKEYSNIPVEDAFNMIEDILE